MHDKRWMSRKHTRYISYIMKKLRKYLRFIGSKHSKQSIYLKQLGMTCSCVLMALALWGCASFGGVASGSETSGNQTSGDETSDNGTTDNSTEDGNGSAADASVDEEPAVQNIFAMDTYMTLQAYGNQAEEALEAAVEEITRIENLVSTGIETSEIAQLNETGTGTVSEDTGELIARSMEIYEDTDGVFDITIYPVMKAWGFTDQNYRVPEKSELEELMGYMGIDKIAYDEDSGEVILAEGTEIDLGGIAKGYTSDRVMDILTEYGVESAVISLGGNVEALGTKTDGSLWRVAVEDPNDTSDYVGIISVADKAVITSGGYERYFEEDGETYHHIIDPSTGYPADSGLSSVSIISEDGTLADGLSTSLFIMGLEGAQGYWRAHADEFDAVLVEDDGTIYVTEGIADSFTSDYDWNIIYLEQQ